MFALPELTERTLKMGISLHVNFTTCKKEPFKDFFLMWIFLKAFIEFATVLLLFFLSVLVVGHDAWILAPSPGVEPTPPVPEDEVSPLDRQEMSQKRAFFFIFLSNQIRKYLIQVRESDGGIILFNSAAFVRKGL